MASGGGISSSQPSSNKPHVKLAKRLNAKAKSAWKKGCKK